MLLCMSVIESTSPSFLQKNVPFADGENKNSPTMHANFCGTMVLFLKNITK